MIKSEKRLKVTDMVGKKQRDIREDNKSVVIDCLLRSQMTLAELEQQLKLSHTALRKVMMELMDLKVVRIIDMKTGEMGRPSALYDIAPDCGCAAAVCLGQKRLEIFIVDMKGFQINKFVSEDNFSNVSEMLLFVREKFNSLLKHKRTEKSGLSTICVSIPFAGVGETPFCECEKQISHDLGECFKSAEIIVKNNNDFWALGENKYGKLHHYHGKSALLCEMEGGVCCSFYYEKVNYCGEKPAYGSFNSIFAGDITADIERAAGESFSAVKEKYLKGEDRAVSIVNAAALPAIKKIAEISQALCVSLVLLDGRLSDLGNGFLAFASAETAKISPDTLVNYSALTDRSPSCAGAVWFASYVSLKKIMGAV